MPTESKSPNTEIAGQASQPPAKTTAKKTFQELVDSQKFKEQVALALPKHITPERFIRVLMTAAIKTPLLMQCTQESLFKGIFDAAAAGVEIDGRRAHLIPFKNNQKQCIEATLILDYKGIAELVMRSGLVSSIHADVVCKNDEFEYDRGLITKHKIKFDGDRGEAYAYYVIIRMRDGGEKVDVMSKSDVDKVRRRSKSSGSGPWVTDYDEMAKKSVFRRASKWVPLSSEIRGVVDGDDDDADRALDVTPKGAGLAALIGAPGSESATMEPETGKIEAGKKSEKPETTDVQTYTPEQRAEILKAVEGLMLDHKVSESRLLLFVHQQKLARDGQDEIRTLDTHVLDGLRTIIPTIKA